MHSESKDGKLTVRLGNQKRKNSMRQNQEPELRPLITKSRSVSKLDIKKSEPTVNLNEKIKDRYRYFYRPYRVCTQKDINKSLKFEIEDHWMNLANIIINTKSTEFQDIIELYRENHNKGYVDTPQRQQGAFVDFFK